MEKDVSALRRGEAERERDRISNIQTEQKTPKEDIRSSIAPEEQEPEITAPKPPSDTQKLVVRGAVVAVVLAVIAAAAWLTWQSRNLDLETKQETAPVQQTQPQEPAPSTPPPAAPAPPPSLLSAPQDRQAQTAQELSSFTDLPDGFTRVFVGTQEASEVFAFLGIADTQDMASKLAEAQVYLHASENRVRPVLVGELSVDVKEAQDAMAAWEASYEEDLVSFTSLAAQKGDGYSPFTRVGAVEGVSVRFLTLSRDDLGVVYAFVNNAFVLTTSFAGMEDAVSQLR